MIFFDHARATLVFIEDGNTTYEIPSQVLRELGWTGTDVEYRDVCPRSDKSVLTLPSRLRTTR
jgi:hypothetical protein